MYEINLVRWLVGSFIGFASRVLHEWIENVYLQQFARHIVFKCRSFYFYFSVFCFCFCFHSFSLLFWKKKNSTHSIARHFDWLWFMRSEYSVQYRMLIHTCIPTYTYIHTHTYSCTYIIYTNEFVASKNRKWIDAYTNMLYRILCIKYTFIFIYMENNRRIGKENENGMNEWMKKTVAIKATIT